MFQNKWKLTAISLALVIVLLASCFIILYRPEAAAAKEPVLLDVSIEGKAKLNVDEFSNYKVNVVGGVGELSYDWSFTPADGKARFYDNGATASIIFKNATEEPYLLEVKVYDEAGNFGVASMAVYDPPTYPSYYLGVSTAPYSYMIKADGTGWYYAVDGNTGAVAWSSTNFTYIFSSASNIITSLGGGVIILKDGQTFITNQTIKPLSNVNVLAESNATIKIQASTEINGIELNSIKNTYWQNIQIDLTGNDPSNSWITSTIVFSGSSDSTIRFEKCNFINTITNANTNNAALFNDTAYPTFENCYFSDIICNDLSHPYFVNCKILQGILLISYSSPKFIESLLEGGIYLDTFGAPLFDNCMITGGVYLNAGGNVTFIGGSITQLNDIAEPAIYISISSGNSTFTNIYICALGTAILINGNNYPGNYWIISNSIIKTLSPGSYYSIQATDSPITNIPIYLCTIIGDLNDVSPSNGTMQGTNVQI